MTDERSFPPGINACLVSQPSHHPSPTLQVPHIKKNLHTKEKPDSQKKERAAEISIFNKDRQQLCSKPTRSPLVSILAKDKKKRKRNHTRTHITHRSIYHPHPLLPPPQITYNSSSHPHSPSHPSNPAQTTAPPAARGSDATWRAAPPRSKPTPAPRASSS